MATLLPLLLMILPSLLPCRAGSWQEEAVALLCSQGHQAVAKGKEVASTVVDGLSVAYRGFEWFVLVTNSDTSSFSLDARDGEELQTHQCGMSLLVWRRRRSEAFTCSRAQVEAAKGLVNMARPHQSSPGSLLASLQAGVNIKPHELFAEEDKLDLEHRVVIAWIVGNGSVLDFAQIEGSTAVYDETCDACSCILRNRDYLESGRGLVYYIWSSQTNHQTDKRSSEAGGLKPCLFLLGFSLKLH